LLTINVDYPDFPPLAEQLQIAEAHAAQNPAIVAFAASFSMRGWDDPGWQQRVIHELDAAFAAGAVAVKVWKNIGMDFRDANGRLVMIDDPRFDAVFDFIRRRQRVLIGHQGEPHNCWLPISEMTVNNDKEYFREHPQYHMFLHPELPSYEQQMAARDRMLAKNPGLKFMGAHLASLEWSVDRLATISRSLSQRGRRSGRAHGPGPISIERDRAKVRRFFIRYQDRLLYGTDVEQEPGADPQALRREVHAKSGCATGAILNTAEIQSVPELDAPVRGLRLPKECDPQDLQQQRPALVRQALGRRRTANGNGVEMIPWMKSLRTFPMLAAALGVRCNHGVGRRAGRAASPAAPQAIGSIEAAT
jgi:hypothetical protein